MCSKAQMVLTKRCRGLTTGLVQFHLHFLVPKKKDKDWSELFEACA